MNAQQLPSEMVDSALRMSSFSSQCITRWDQQEDWPEILIGYSFPFCTFI
jgi:hypothetical protein